MEHHDYRQEFKHLCEVVCTNLKIMDRALQELEIINQESENCIGCGTNCPEFADNNNNFNFAGNLDEHDNDEDYHENALESFHITGGVESINIGEQIQCSDNEENCMYNNDDNYHGNYASDEDENEEDDNEDEYEENENEEDDNEEDENEEYENEEDNEEEDEYEEYNDEEDDYEEDDDEEDEYEEDDDEEDENEEYENEEDENEEDNDEEDEYEEDDYEDENEEDNLLNTSNSFHITKAMDRTYFEDQEESSINEEKYYVKCVHSSSHIKGGVESINVGKQIQCSDIEENCVSNNECNYHDNGNSDEDENEEDYLPNPSNPFYITKAMVRKYFEDHPESLDNYDSDLDEKPFHITGDVESIYIGKQVECSNNGDNCKSINDGNFHANDNSDKDDNQKYDVPNVSNQTPFTKYVARNCLEVHKESSVNIDSHVDNNEKMCAKSVLRTLHIPGGVKSFNNEELLESGSSNEHESKEYHPMTARNSCQMRKDLKNLNAWDSYAIFHSLEIQRKQKRNYKECDKQKEKSLPSFHPSDEIKQAMNCKFSKSKLMEMSNAPFRKYLESRELHAGNVCDVFNILIEIEDSFSMSQYRSLMRPDVQIKWVHRNEYTVQIANCGMIEELLSPFYDEVIIMSQHSCIQASKKTHPIDNLEPHKNELPAGKNPRRYVGRIVSVTRSTVNFIWGNPNKELAPFADLERKGRNREKYRIMFRSLRLHIRYQRHALKKLRNAPKLLKYLFPCVNPSKDLATIELRLINSEIAGNPEQLQAVRDIVEGPILHAPYVIFGPPGTGKSTTIIESIIQLRLHPRRSRILVSAASNAACDTIALRIIKYFDTNPGLLDQCALIRIYAKSVPKRDSFKQIEKTLLQNSNCRGPHWFPPIRALQKFHVIVATLGTVGTYIGMGLRNLNFTHIFIDEASATTEPETLVAIVSLKEETCSVILSGDHKQLGPVVKSQRAAALGLDQSLMERLLLRDCYALDSKGDYDRSLQARLRRNYRSHPEILGLYNHLYYNNELIAAASNHVSSLFGDWPELPNPKFPIIFKTVHGSMKKCNTSYSSGNQLEIVAVMQYVKSLLKYGANGHRVSQADIGIITPYKFQCQLIQEALLRYNWISVEVGSVEMYQGREKPVIIVSLVRSFSGLGFVSSPRRLNVIISRAKSLLILIGNPLTLTENEDLKYIIDKCYKHSTFISAEENILMDQNGGILDMDKLKADKTLELAGELCPHLTVIKYPQSLVSAESHSENTEVPVIQEELDSSCC